MGKGVIIACDFDSKQKFMDFLDLFTDEKPFVIFQTPLESQWQYWLDSVSICVMFMLLVQKQ